MQKSIANYIGIQAIRFLAGTQAFGMVTFHGGWILLALATWGFEAGPDSSTATVSRALVRAYAWLGGVDENGRGDGTLMMVVWAKLSLVVYLIDAAIRGVRGERKPVALWRIALASGAIALSGYLIAFWPTAKSGFENVFPAVLFSVLTVLATAWAVLAQRLGEFLVARIRNESVSTAVAQERKAPQSTLR
ncbi:MAG: hypothetical protein ACT4NL_01940 [Pseudomarimonas sp.]